MAAALAVVAAGVVTGALFRPDCLPLDAVVVVVVVAVVVLRVVVLLVVVVVVEVVVVVVVINLYLKEGSLVMFEIVNSKQFKYLPFKIFQ